MKILAQPVDIIVKFIVKEKPTPIKFRYQNDDGKEIEIKIDKVIKIEEIREVGFKTYIYHCQSKIGGVDRRLELKYILDKCSWQLFKM